MATTEEIAASAEWLADSLKQDCDRALEYGESCGVNDMPLNAMLNVTAFLDKLGYSNIAMRFAFLMGHHEYNWNDEPEWATYMKAYDRDTMTAAEFLDEYGEAK